MYKTQHPRRDSNALENHIEEVKQQKKLLEDQIAKAEQTQENLDAVEELRNSVFMLDRDLSSMSKLVARKEEKKKNTQEFPTIVTSPPIHISGSHPYPQDSLLTSSRASTEPGLVNKAVETSKWWMKGVSSAIASVSSYLSWGSAEVVSTSPPKEYKDDRGSYYAEFEVMQINWYWRRTYFSFHKMVNLHTRTKEDTALFKGQVLAY